MSTIDCGAPLKAKKGEDEPRRCTNPIRWFHEAGAGCNVRAACTTHTSAKDGVRVCVKCEAPMHERATCDCGRRIEKTGEGWKHLNTPAGREAEGEHDAAPAKTKGAATKAAPSTEEEAA